MVCSNILIARSQSKASMEKSPCPAVAIARPSPLKVSVSFRNGDAKTLERFLTARSRFETPDKEKAELFRVFQRFDTDGDGRLCVEEIRGSLEKLGVLVSAEDLSSLFTSETSGEDDGYVGFADFYALYKSLCQEDEEDGISTPTGKLLDSDLRSAFGLFDKNNDNLISVIELQSVLISLGFKEANSIDECKGMIAKVDSDGDGMVNFDEFKVMMKKMKEED